MGDLKIFDLSTFKHTHNLKTFVETGTFRGEGVEHARYYFDSVHSIEIDEEMYNETLQKFVEDSCVHLHLGNSYEVLKKILPLLTTNCLFWLDAHFPGADAHKVPYDNEQDMDRRAPLDKELNVIKSRIGQYQDVIIVDDLWLYDDKDRFEWGTFDEHSARCNFNISREQLMKNKSIDFVFNVFSESHDIRKQKQHQGYLILTPKET